MSALKVPEHYYPGFESLLRLDNTVVEKLILALKEVKPTQTLESLVAQVASKSQIPVKEIEEILPVLVSLYTLRSYTGQTTDEIVTAVVDAVRTSKDLHKPKGWKETAFSETLTKLLMEWTEDRAMSAIYPINANEQAVEPKPSPASKNMPQLVEENGLRLLRFYDPATPVKGRIAPGSAKGRVIMSEDFDAPLDDFEDYM